MELPSYISYLGWAELLEDGSVTESDKIPPYFFRDGVYLSKSNGICWAEFDGRAFKYDQSQFEYELSLLDHKPLRTKELRATQILIQEGLADKKLKDLYYIDNCVSDLRNLRRDVYKSRIDLFGDNK